MEDQADSKPTRQSGETPVHPIVRPQKRFRVEIVIDACDIEEAQWRIEDLLDRQENLSPRETITGDGWIKVEKRECGYDNESDYRKAFSEYRKQVRSNE